MGGLFGGGKGQSRSEPRLNAIDITQSSYGNVVPLVYGTTRVPGFLMWYGAFTATAHTEKVSGGKGGPKASTNTTYTYTAALMIGVCEGPIGGVPTAYADKSQTQPSDIDLTTFTGGGPQSVWSFLTTNFPTQAIPYDRTAYLASGAFELGSSAAMPNLSFEVYGLARHDPGVVNDAEPSDIVIDYCTDVHHGCNFNQLGTLQGVGATTWETWCIANGFFLSPAEKAQRKAREFLDEILRITNSAAVGSADLLRFVPYGDEAVTGNGRTFTPSLSPLYSFTDDDYVVKDGQDPVRVRRKPQAEVFNVVRVEYLDRANQYNTAIAEAKDDAHIALYGERVMDTVRFHAITSASVARKVAQHILQRQLYVLNEYEFTLRTDYCLLEPMDLVAVTDSELGLSAQLARVVRVAEDEEHEPTITAEEVPIGVSSAPTYAWGAAQGYAANFAATPGSVATPLIFMAPPMLVSGQGGYEIWIAAAGTGAVWGGCEVHLSFDNATYGYVGAIAGAARYGTLLTAFGTGADPDTGTVNFQLVDTARTLVAGNTSDADELRTLLYVDGEVMSYRDATLIGTGQYTLGYFRRGKYGTTRAAHAIGTAWARIDSALFRMPIDPGMVGKTLYFKFPSFNVYGQGLQDLSACTAYSFTVKPSAQPGQMTYVLGGVTQVGSTFVKTIGTSGTYDAQAYSNEGFSTGCYVSAQAGQTNAQILFGLNSDPTTDANYTSLDFCWYIDSAGNCGIYENGSSQGTFGSYTTATVFAISCDGFFVRYFKDGTEVRRVAAPPSKLHFDSSFATTGGKLVNVTFQPLSVDANTSTKFQLAGVSQVGTTLRKLSTGASAWDSQAYSSEAYGGGCYAAARGAQTNGAVMFGLNSDPLTDANFASIDFAWYLTAAGTLEIYENGTNYAGFGSYSTSTALAISWDGGRVRYWKDGVVVREVPYASGKLYFDSSFYSAGAGFNDVQFSPLGVVAGGLIQGAALNRDPNFQDASAWVSTSGNPLAAARFVTITDGVAGLTALRSAANQALDFEGADRIVVDPAKTYRLRGRVRASVNNTLRRYTGIDLRDSAGAIIAGAGTYWSYGGASYALTPSTWTEDSFVFGAGTANPIPSNARTMQPLALLNYDSGSGYMEMQDFRIEEAIPTNLLGPNAATVVASVTDVGPLNFTLTAPATSTSLLVKQLDLTGSVNALATVEVSASFRLGFTGSGYTAKVYLSYFDGTTTTRKQIGERTINTYANEGGVATFTLTNLDNVYFRLEIDITGNGVDSVTATFRDLQMRATAVKR